MSDVLKKFWGWVVSLAVVGGLYFAADAVQAVWAFWALIGIAVVLTIVSKLMPVAKRMVTKLRAYPGLITEIETLKTEGFLIKFATRGYARTTSG